MGRSGGDKEDESAFCCAEGVRRIVTLNGAKFDICPRDQKCCPGLVERQKLYKERLTIFECVVVSNMAIKAKDVFNAQVFHLLFIYYV